jgi:hypothetical protein
MSEIDDRIRGALDADDKAFLDSLDEERGILRQYGDTFHGRNSWVVWIVNFFIFASTAVGLYAAWGFINADGTDSLIRWAALGWAGWTLQIAFKSWLTDRMNMQTVLREVKRLQALVAARD